jgi:transcriptional regulator with XRE-family HTH domain
MSEVELHGKEDTPSDRDDLDEHLDERLCDPQFRAAYEDALARSSLLGALTAQRAAQGASQVEIAIRMGTTQSAVSDLERGATDPRFSTLQRYARAVGCRLHLVLHATQARRGGSWRRVQDAPAHRGVPVVASVGDFWAPVLSYVAREGRPRFTALAAPPATRVIPVELRAAPDEYARAVAR